ncbi:MAG: hypothetical protein ACRD1V_10065, partial [Vicinamibacterales bacterium]
GVSRESRHGRKHVIDGRLTAESPPDSFEIVEPILVRRAAMELVADFQTCRVQSTDPSGEAS